MALCGTADIRQLNAAVREWGEQNQALFSVPTAGEGAFVARIYGVPHFHQNIEQQKLLKGGRNADPFIIARAATEDRTVVTMEVFKQNSAKIPISASTLMSAA